MTAVAATAQFHLAFAVRDLDEARAFYGGVLGCAEGRSTDHHVDFDLFGHHVVAHLAPAGDRPAATSEFDGRDVPIPHFGLNLARGDFDALARRLTAAGARFRDRPHVRHAGLPSEHATLFVFDPSGNAIELKAFRDPAQCFAVRE